MSFIAIPTLAGQAALLAAVDPVDPVPLVLSELVVGDGGGFPTAPVETQTGLVNQRAVVPLAAVVRDQNKMTLDAVLDETVGGFTIREAGILDENGVLMFVASVPATEKLTVAENVEDVLTLGLVIVVSDTAQVTLLSQGTTYATHDYVNERIAALRTNIATPLRPYFIAVKSMALAAPPPSPAPGDAYVVAADATGPWAGQVNRVAQYIGFEIWVFSVAPIGHFVGNEATGLLMQRISSGWRAYMPAHPTTGGPRWLQIDNDGTRSWTDPFNIVGLTTRDIAGDDEFGFHDTSVGSKAKNTVDHFVSHVMTRLRSASAGVNFFMSGH